MDMSTILLHQDAKDALAAPLDLNNVKQRKGAGGRKLDYISGEHAIAEANRIFGFDGWSCETIHMECVKENPPTYIARVRVRAGGVTREGWAVITATTTKTPSKGQRSTRSNGPCGRLATSLACLVRQGRERREPDPWVRACTKAAANPQPGVQAPTTGGCGKTR